MNLKTLISTWIAVYQWLSNGCGFDPHSKWNIYLKLYFHFFALASRQSAAFSSATQHAMPPEFGRKWGTEWLNTRFLLPTLLYAGYSVKLIIFFYCYQFNVIIPSITIFRAIFNDIFYVKIWMFINRHISLAIHIPNNFICMKVIIFI